MQRKFVVHDQRDSVGVAIREIASGERAEGVILGDGGVVRLEARQPIPFGHKIALRDLAAGSEVTRYGSCIGVATQPIAQGDHVHIHNVRSGRC